MITSPLTPPLARDDRDAAILASTNRVAIVRLLAAYEAPRALLVTRDQGTYRLEALPTVEAWRADAPLVQWIETDLLPRLADPSTPARFQCQATLPAPRRFLFPRRDLRQDLVVLRLDAERIPQSLLVIPLEAAAPRRGPEPDYRGLLVRRTPLEPELSPAETPASPVLGNWESLADVLEHGLILCDEQLQVHYLNQSASERLGLDPLSTLGRSVLSLGWDVGTRGALQQTIGQLRTFRRSVEYQHPGQRVVECDLSVRPHGGGLVLECLFPERDKSASGQYVPLGSPQPPPAPALDFPLPTWEGRFALQEFPRAQTGATWGRSLALGGGLIAHYCLSLPEDTPAEWESWGRQVAARLEQLAHALKPTPDLLAEIAQSCLLACPSGFPGSLVYGRMHPEFRTYEWGCLGPMQFALWRHGTGEWREPLPDRTLYLGHGCPTLNLYQGELLPGEGLCAGRAIGPWLAALGTNFPHLSWTAIREVLEAGQGETAPLDILGRLSGGALEERLLYPADFKVFSDTLKMRLESRGIDSHTIFQVRVALDEIFSNAHRHGHRGDASLPIAVQMLLEEGCLRLSLADRGTGYDPLLLRDPTTAEAILESGGRGVFLARETMDALEYGERTSRMTLTKYFVREAGDS